MSFMTWCDRDLVSLNEITRAGGVFCLGINFMSFMFLFDILYVSVFIVRSVISLWASLAKLSFTISNNVIRVEQ